MISFSFAVSTALLITNTGLSNTMDIYNSGGPEVSIRSLKKDSMKFVLTNTDLRYCMQDYEADAALVTHTSLAMTRGSVLRYVIWCFLTMVIEPLSADNHFVVAFVLIL